MHMQEAGIGSLLKLILVLFLSVRDAPQNPGQGPELGSVAPAGAIASAVLDVTQVRATVRYDDELAKALFDGRTPEAAYGEAIEALSERTRVDPAALRDAIAPVHTVGFWALGMADRRQPRFVVVFDRGGAPDILPRLLANRPAGNGAGDGVLPSVVYAGRTVYAVGRDPREALWLAEFNGLVVLASDALAAETFLLQAGAAAKTPPAARVYLSGLVPPLLEVKADVGTLVNGWLPAMGDHDRAEFMAAGAFVDLPAWRGVTLRVDPDTIGLRAEFAPGSPLAEALQPPQNLELPDAIPADSGLAAVVGVRDASRIWNLCEAGFSHVALFERGNNPREEFIRDFQRGSGLDVQRDVIPDLVAAAVVITDPARGLRINQGGAFYFEGKDPARMLTLVQALLAREHREGPAEPEVREGVKVWRTGDTLIALKGKVALVAPSQGEAQAVTERLLTHFIAGGEGLRKIMAARQAGAATFATLDAARCFPQSGFDRLTAGLTVGPDGRWGAIRVESGGPNLVTGILRLIASGNRAASARAMQTRALSNLRMVALACIQYEAEQGKLPAMLADVATYLKAPDSAWRDPRSGSSIRLNPAIAGQKLDAIKNPNGTVLAYYGPSGPEAQPLCAAFCDGSVRIVTPAQLEAGLKPAPQKD
jgi:hypothetical protein